MTYYPKASAAGAGSTASASNTSGVSASVKFPEIEERILKSVSYTHLTLPTNREV